MNLRLLNRTEIKIFLTFLIVYSLFVHWVGWNEESRMALTKAIVIEGRFEIDNYANFTGDRAFYKDHYYSDKAPGTSFLAVPIYIISNYISEYIPNHLEDKTLIPQPQFNTTVYTIFYPPPEDLISRILTTIFFSALPGALLIVLIYKISKFFVKKLNYRLFIALSFTLGTLLLLYSTVIMENVLATFFGFLAFYIIFKILRKELAQKYFILSGILLGFSIVVSYLMIVIFAGLMLLLLLSKTSQRSILYFFLGSAVGILPLLMYNFAIFSNPFQFTMFYIDPNISPCNYNLLPTCPKLELKDWLIHALSMPLGFLVILFSSYRGFLFYTPFLLLSFAGLYYLYKRDKNLAKSLLFIFFLFLLFLHFYPYWHGGGSFGQRYLVFIIPFLSIPLAIFLQKAWRNIYLRALFLVLLSISVFNNFLGLSATWEGYIYMFYEEGIKASVSWSTKSFEIHVHSIPILNPLYEHYLPLFLKDGSRSRILEYLLIGEIPDIRDFRPIPAREIKLSTLPPFGILVLKIPFLIIPVLLLIITLIWRKELFVFRFKNVPISLFLSILIILLFVSRLEFKDVVYNKEWYPLGANETIRWMSQDAILRIFHPRKENVFLNISLESYRTKTLDLFLNDNLINSYTQTFKILERVNLEDGENTLRFHSKEGCDRPIFTERQCSTYLECAELNISLSNLSHDPRCLSFGLESIEILSEDELKAENETLFYGSNWYPEEVWENQTYRYMSQDATILLLPRPKRVKLNISIDTYKKPRILDLYLNGKLIDSYSINSFFTNILTPEMELNKDINILKFHSREGCDMPSKLDNSTDIRCLSFVVKNITKLTTEKLIESGKTLIFSKNWYYPEENLTRAYNNATIYYLSSINKNAKFNISLSSYYKPRNVQLHINDNLVGTYRIETYTNSILTPEMKINGGENVLKFYSVDGCDIPAEVEGVNDTRCLSFGLENISTITVEELMKRNETFIFSSNWYEKEKDRRFSSGNSMIFLFAPKSINTRFNISLMAYNEPRKLDLFINGNKIDSYIIDKKLEVFLTKPVQLKKGENRIFFATSERCESPFEVERTNDTRCLNFKLVNISLFTSKDLSDKADEVIFAEGWYPSRHRHQAYWLMKNESTILIYSKSIKHVKLALSLRSYLKPRNLEILFNNERVEMVKVGSNSITTFTQTLRVLPGENTLEFRSPQGCDILGEIGKSNDTRCISFIFDSIQTFTLNELLEKDTEVFYGSNWYSIECYDDICIRWLSQNATLYLLSPKEHFSKLNFSAISYHEPRSLKIYLDGKEISSYLVSNVSRKNILTPLVKLSKRENTINFFSREGCDLPYEIENSSDKRCLSFAISSIEKLTIDKLFKKNLDIVYKRFFDEEKTDGMKFRWMSKDAEISFLTKSSGIYKLILDSWSFDKNRSVKIYLDNKSISSSLITKEIKQITLPLTFLSRGEHVLRFYIDSCGYPKNDIRCLGIAVSNFTKTDATLALDNLDEELDKNWHGLEVDDKGRIFRWISQNATIQIFNPTNKKRCINIGFTIWNYFKPRKLYIYLNEKEITTVNVSKKLTRDFAFELNLGLNELSFYSSEGCDMPVVVENSIDTRCLSFVISDLSIK